LGVQTNNKVLIHLGNFCKDALSFVFLQKNPLATDSQLGVFVIRVHLPLLCSEINQYAPDNFVQILGYMFVFAHKKIP